MSTILLFNATGAQGSTIAKRLLEKGYRVIAPVRSEKSLAILEERNIEAFRTDFSTASLLPHAKKADKIILQIPAAIAPGLMIALTQNATEAIRRAGTAQTVFVISSTIPKERVGVKSVDARWTMVNIAQEKIPGTPILSATEYLENFSTAYRKAIVEDRIIPQTIPPNFPVNYLSWNDLATYVLAALESNKLEGKVYPIGGNEGISGLDLANRLGKILGNPINYVPVTHQQLEGFLTPIMGPEVAKDYAAFYHWQDTDGAALLNPNTSALRQLLDIQLASFEDWAIQAFKDRIEL